VGGADRKISSSSSMMGSGVMKCPLAARVLFLRDGPGPESSSSIAKASDFSTVGRAVDQVYCHQIPLRQIPL
jgi:hypothetical protein